jgi:hypothetical protein
LKQVTARADVFIFVLLDIRLSVLPGGKMDEESARIWEWKLLVAKPKEVDEASELGKRYD